MPWSGLVWGQSMLLSEEVVSVLQAELCCCPRLALL